MARVLRGAFGLPTSGRELGLKPFRTVKGVPDWKDVIPAIDQPPRGYLKKCVGGLGRSHTYRIVSRWLRSKSLGPRSSFSPPRAMLIDVRWLPEDWLPMAPTPSLVLSMFRDQV